MPQGGPGEAGLCLKHSLLSLKGRESGVGPGEVAWVPFSAPPAGLGMNTGLHHGRGNTQKPWRHLLASKPFLACGWGNPQALWAAEKRRCFCLISWSGAGA